MNGDQRVEKLLALSNRRHVLEVLRDAFSQNISNKEILIEDYGLMPDEIEWFFSEVAQEEEDLMVSRLLPMIDRMIMEIDDEMLEIVSKEVAGIRIIILNNWKELIGSTWMGTFKGREIEKIEEDKLIILSSTGKEWRGIQSEENITLIGPGIYYCKFYLKDMKDFVTHYTHVHGVLLPKHILEKARRSPPLTYGKFSSHYRKYLTTIALDYNLYDPEDAARLKRIYTRIMYENLSVFEIFLKAIRSMTELDDPKNISMISALPDYFNKILVTKDRYERLLESDNIDVPGLMGYEPGIESVFEIASIDLGETLITLKELKNRFINYGWEVMKRLLPR